MTSFRWRTRESNDEIPYTHHPYAYALSNPVLYTDPRGTCVSTEDRNGCYGEQSFGTQIIEIMREYNLYSDAFNSLTPGNPQMAAAVWRLMDRHPMQAQTYDPRQDSELPTLIEEEFYGDPEEVVLQILQMVTAWQLDHIRNSSDAWTYAAGIIGTVGITDGPAGFCSPDRGGGGGGGGFRGSRAEGFDWDHIYERHSPEGGIARQRTDGTVFEGLTQEQIQARVKAAWENRQRRETQVDPRTGVRRVRYRGTDPVSSQTVEMWHNEATGIVETAYPLP